MYVIENCHIFGQGNRRHFLQTHHLLRDDMANNLVSKDALYVSLNFILSAPSSSPGANQTRDDAQELRALAKRQQRVRSKMRPADGCQFLATIGDVDPSQISGKMLSRSLLLVGGGASAHVLLTGEKRIPAEEKNHRHCPQSGSSGRRGSCPVERRGGICENGGGTIRRIG